MRASPVLADFSPHYFVFSKEPGEPTGASLGRVMTKLADLDVDVVLLHVDPVHYEDLLTAVKPTPGIIHFICLFFNLATVQVTRNVKKNAFSGEAAGEN